jgi:hypothetical protein
VIRESSVDPIPARDEGVAESIKKRGRPAKKRKSEEDCPIKSCAEVFEDKSEFGRHLVEIHGMEQRNVERMVDGIWDGGSDEVGRQGVVDMELTELPIAIFNGLKELANTTLVQLKGQTVFTKDLKQMYSRVQVWL